MSDSDPLPQDKAHPGGVVFVVFFLICALFLLSQIGEQTKFSARGSLVAQPRFWPAVGVGGMVLFGALHVLLSWRTERPGWGAEVFTWARALEFLAWFMVYVWTVPIIGYLLATVVFTVLLTLRVGYRDRLQLGLAAVAGFGIVFVFKTLLSVKIPGGAIYEYLPAALRNFMIVNF